MSVVSLEQPAGRLAVIKDALGPPVWEAEDALLYCGDCVELMGRLPPAVVDLTITSPPYNIGKAYERPLPLQEYLDWCGVWLTEVARLTSVSGAFWLNLGYVPAADRARALPLPYLLWDRVPMHLMQEIVWHYGAGVASRRMFSPRNEKWLWYVKGAEDYTFNLDDVRDPKVKYPNQRKNGKVRVNPLGKNPSDVWIVPKVTTGENMTGRRASPERTSHPAQFPEAVIERIIKACSDPCDVVLDPFGGSGTTSAVASRLGRASVLFELSPVYVDVAISRMRRRRRHPEFDPRGGVQPSLL